MLAVGKAAFGLGAAFVALGTTSANQMTKLAASAKQLNMSAMTLDNWQNAVRLAGGDADAFTSSIMNMNEAFRNLKIGEVKEDFIKATGMSGADFSKLQSMSNDQRLRTIWSALENVKDPQKQQALISKIFGQGGVDLFSRLQLQGRSLSDVYAQASKMNPNTQADYDAAIKGSQLNESIAVSFENTIKKIGIEIEKGLMPELKGLADWLVNNKDGLNSFAKAIGEATKAVIGFFGFLFQSKDQQRTSMLGGPVNEAIFNRLERARGIAKDSAGEGLMTLGLAGDTEYQNMIKNAPFVAKANPNMTPDQIATQVFQRNEADRIRGAFVGLGLSDKILAGIYEKERKTAGGNPFFNEGDYLKGARKSVEQTLNIVVNGRPISQQDQQALYDKLMTMGILQ